MTRSLNPSDKSQLNIQGNHDRLILSINDYFNSQSGKEPMPKVKGSLWRTRKQLFSRKKTKSQTNQACKTCLNQKIIRLKPVTLGINTGLAT